MYLMRLGPVGSERPVVRIDDSHYLDVSDVVDDFDEAFFGSNGLTRVADARPGAEHDRTAPGVRRGKGSELRSPGHTRFSASG